MQAEDDYLMKFLSQNNVRFEIPVYQRNYDWGEEHFRQLLSDIEVCIDNNQSSYFVVSIVHIQDRGPMTITGINKAVVIYGQQRITTVNLLLLAIASRPKFHNMWVYFLTPPPEYTPFPTKIFQFVPSQKDFKLQGLRMRFQPSAKNNSL